MGRVVMEYGPNGEDPAIKAAESCTFELRETSIHLQGTLAAIRKAKRGLQLFMSKTFICTFQIPTPEATAAAGRMLGKVPWVWDVKLHGHNLLRLHAHEASLEQACKANCLGSSVLACRNDGSSCDLVELEWYQAEFTSDCGRGLRFDDFIFEL